MLMRLPYVNYAIDSFYFNEDSNFNVRDLKEIGERAKKIRQRTKENCLRREVVNQNQRKN